MFSLEIPNNHVAYFSSIFRCISVKNVYLHRTFAVVTWRLFRTYIENMHVKYFVKGNPNMLQNPYVITWGWLATRHKTQNNFDWIWLANRINALFSLWIVLYFTLQHKGEYICFACRPRKKSLWLLSEPQFFSIFRASQKGVCLIAVTVIYQADKRQTTCPPVSYNRALRGEREK